MRRRKTCGAVLHFEVLGGMLIRRQGRLSARCPACGDRTSPRTAAPGARCRAKLAGRAA